MKRAFLMAAAVLGVLAITPAAWATFGDCNGNNSCNTTTTNNQGKGGDGGNATATGGNSSVGNVTGGNATGGNSSVGNVTGGNSTSNANNNGNGNGNLNGNNNGNNNGNLSNVGNATQGQGQDQEQSNSNNNADSVDVSVEGDDVDVEAAANGVPVYTAPIVASEDTCMGSVSGGAGFGAMSFTVGVSVGSTYTDENCQNLKWYREFAKTGKVNAAMAIACQANDGRNVIALKAEGIDCDELTGGKAPKVAMVETEGTVQTASAPASDDAVVNPTHKRGNNK